MYFGGTYFSPWYGGRYARKLISLGAAFRHWMSCARVWSLTFLVLCQDKAMRYDLYSMGITSVMWIRLREGVFRMKSTVWLACLCISAQYVMVGWGGHSFEFLVPEMGKEKEGGKSAFKFHLPHSYSQEWATVTDSSWIKDLYISE